MFSMCWLRDLQQTLSYNVGLGLGCNSLPFECPVWADETTCRHAYAEGAKPILRWCGIKQLLLVVIEPPHHRSPPQRIA